MAGGRIPRSRVLALRAHLALRLGPVHSAEADDPAVFVRVRRLFSVRRCEQGAGGFRTGVRRGHRLHPLPAPHGGDGEIPLGDMGDAPLSGALHLCVSFLPAPVRDLHRHPDVHLLSGAHGRSDEAALRRGPPPVRGSGRLHGGIRHELRRQGRPGGPRPLAGRRHGNHRHHRFNRNVPPGAGLGAPAAGDVLFLLRHVRQLFSRTAHAQGVFLQRGRELHLRNLGHLRRHRQRVCELCVPVHPVRRLSRKNKSRRRVHRPFLRPGGPSARRSRQGVGRIERLGGLGGGKRGGEHRHHRNLHDSPDEARGLQTPLRGGGRGGLFHRRPPASAHHGLGGLSSWRRSPRRTTGG